MLVRIIEISQHIQQCHTNKKCSQLICWWKIKKYATDQA